MLLYTTNGDVEALEPQAVGANPRQPMAATKGFPLHLGPEAARLLMSAGFTESMDETESERQKDAHDALLQEGTLVEPPGEDSCAGQRLPARASVWQQMSSVGGATARPGVAMGCDLLRYPAGSWKSHADACVHVLAPAQTVVGGGSGADGRRMPSSSCPGGCVADESRLTGEGVALMSRLAVGNKKSVVVVDAETGASMTLRPLGDGFQSAAANRNAAATALPQADVGFE